MSQGHLSFQDLEQLLTVRQLLHCKDMASSNSVSFLLQKSGGGNINLLVPFQGKKMFSLPLSFPVFKVSKMQEGWERRKKKTKQREGFLSVLSTPPVHPHPQKVHLKHHFLDAARTYTAENKQANRLHAIYGVYVLIRCRA